MTIAAVRPVIFDDAIIPIIRRLITSREIDKRSQQYGPVVNNDFSGIWIALA